MYATGRARRDVQVLETVGAGRRAVPGTGRETDETVAGEQGPESRAGLLSEDHRQARVRAERHEGRRHTAEPASGQGGVNAIGRAAENRVVTQPAKSFYIFFYVPTPI